MRAALARKLHTFFARLFGIQRENPVLPRLSDIRDRSYFVSKRIFDVGACLFLIPVLLGICLVIMVLNPVWNRGPLFYVQRRAGKDGQEFPMVKFRSMSSEGHGMRRADDPLDTARITPLGRWLRDYKIDELPQIFNVLLGHMSLVGPRPEASTFVPIYRDSIPGYGLRETVRPGMTGYAQVMQGYTDSIEMVRRKTELDLFYIRNSGWRLDLFVILSTVGVVLSPRRASGAGETPAQQEPVPVKDAGNDGTDHHHIGRSCRVVQ